MAALKTHGQTLDAELKSLLHYFGEDALQTKPEELFDLVASFSSQLLVCLSLCLSVHPHV
jgi:hypothetical protein